MAGKKKNKNPVYDKTNNPRRPFAKDADGKPINDLIQEAKPAAAKLGNPFMEDDDEATNATGLLRARAVIESLRRGALIEQACEAAGLHRTQFWRLRKNDRGLQEAFDEARESRIQVVEDALYKSAVGYSHEQIVKRVERDAQTGDITKQVIENRTIHVNPNPHAAMFYLKNRAEQAWRSDMTIKLETSHTDRREVDINMTIEGVIADMSIEDLELLNELCERIGTKAQNHIEAEATEVGGDSDSSEG